MELNQNEYVLYEEKQYFRQWWLWAIFIGIAGLYLYSIFEVLSGAESLNEISREDLIGMIIAAFISLGFPLLFLKLHLVTELYSSELRIQLFPFMLRPRVIPLDSILAFKDVEYNALLEYGGWGIRFGRKGIAYNASGNRGVQIVLKDGKRILIGSQRSTEFSNILGNAINRYHD